MRWVWILLLVGCGANNPAQPVSDRSAYPLGPYGVVEGAAIENLRFTAASGHDVALADLHASANNQLLLLSTAAGWCTACIEEQPALQHLYSTHAAHGLVVLVALFENDTFGVADSALAAAWQRRYGLQFPVVADPTFSLARYYDRRLTPMNMIVDLGTMEILRVTTGWDASIVEAILEARL